MSSSAAGAKPTSTRPLLPPGSLSSSGASLSLRRVSGGGRPTFPLFKDKQDGGGGDSMGQVFSGDDQVVMTKKKPGASKSQSLASVFKAVF